MDKIVLQNFLQRPARALLYSCRAQTALTDACEVDIVLKYELNLHQINQMNLLAGMWVEVISLGWKT